LKTGKSKRGKKTEGVGLEKRHLEPQALKRREKSLEFGLRKEKRGGKKRKIKPPDKKKKKKKKKPRGPPASIWRKKTCPLQKE